jgi:hypothetical protein
VSWETIGLPVIDRSGFGRLRGVDLISISKSEEKYFLPSYYVGKKNHQKRSSQQEQKGSIERSFDENGESEDDDELGDEDHTSRGEDLDHNLSQPLLLLCQQSEVGDLYCQRIEIIPRQSPRTAPIQLK